MEAAASRGWMRPGGELPGGSSARVQVPACPRRASSAAAKLTAMATDCLEVPGRPGRASSAAAHATDRRHGMQTPLSGTEPARERCQRGRAGPAWSPSRSGTALRSRGILAASSACRTDVTRGRCPGHPVHGPARREDRRAFCLGPLEPGTCSVIAVAGISTGSATGAGRWHGTYLPQAREPIAVAASRELTLRPPFTLWLATP